MCRTTRAFWRSFRLPARMASRVGVAALLAASTAVIVEVPTSVHAAAATVSIVNGDAATTPSTLANILLGPGATLNAPARINGALAFTANDLRLRSYGTFSNGTSDVGIDSGLIISANANAATFATATIAARVSVDRQDAALGALLATQSGFCTVSPCTHNATDLSFSIVPSGDFIKFEYSLMVTETGTWNGSAWSGDVFNYPDGFALFVNGESPANNCATVPVSNALLTMKTAKVVAPQGSAAANRAAALATVSPNQMFAYAAQNSVWAVKFLTVPLTCVVDVSAANAAQTPVTVRIVVADVNDANIPPAVLLKAGSVRFEAQVAPQVSPAWTDLTLGTMQVNTSYIDGVSASGDPVVTYSQSAGVLPVGLTLNTTTGAITGTPTVAGPYDFTITVANGNLPDLVKQFTGLVVQPPAWTDDTIAAPLQVGLAVSDGVTASGSPAPTFSLSAGTLPAGLLLDSVTGAITGTPTAAGPYSFTLAAGNGVGTAINTVFAGIVTVAPAWVDQTLGTIEVNTPYVDGVSASGLPTVTYSVSAGVLPDGLVLDSTTGAITGTPTSGGAYDFTITVANGSLPDLVKRFTNIVVETPAWTDVTIGWMHVGTPFEDGVAASGSPAPSFTVTSGTLPAGLALDSATGAITGTPTEAGPYDFTISAGNGIGFSVEQRFTGTVTQPTGGFLAITPVRLLDTREGGGRLIAGSVMRLPVGGVAGVAADATSAVLNVTAAHPDASGFITVFGCEDPTPLTSNVNFMEGETVANAVNVSLDSSGGVCLFSTATTDVVVDLSGFYSASVGVGRLVAVEPYRLADTREGGTTLEAGSSYVVDITGHGVPDDVTAVLLDITVDAPATAGFVTAYSCGEPLPLASNLNFVAGQTITNSAVVKVGSDHTVCFYVSTATHLVIDINGAFSPSSPVGFPMNVHPKRLVDTRPSSPVAGQTAMELKLAEMTNLPGNATAVTLNVTVDGPQGPGFVTVYPCSSALPLASNLNFLAAQTVAESVTVPLGIDATICVFTTSTTDLVIDLNEVYVGAS